jgi:hypothetical protein
MRSMWHRLSWGHATRATTSGGRWWAFSPSVAGIGRTASAARAAGSSERKGVKLFVAELDAIAGTPVPDLKPVMREFLPREPLRQPQWSHELVSDYWGTHEGSESAAVYGNPKPP